MARHLTNEAQINPLEFGGRVASFGEEIQSLDSWECVSCSHSADPYIVLHEYVYAKPKDRSGKALKADDGNKYWVYIECPECHKQEEQSRFLSTRLNMRIDEWRSQT